MSIHRRFAGITAAFLLIVSINPLAHAELLRLRYAVWVGFGPLFVA